jgi:hypothetical protein
MDYSLLDLTHKILKIKYLFRNQLGRLFIHFQETIIKIFLNVIFLKKNYFAFLKNPLYLPQKKPMKRYITLSLISIFFSFAAKAQLGDYKSHTVYVYNFTKYIQWPASYQNGDFVIAVFGTSPITSQLRNATANKTVGTQKIVVKQVNGLAAVENPHILFVPNLQSANLAAIKQKLAGKSTLIVTEKTGLAKQGSHINFILRDGKWRIEMNADQVEAAGLKISSQLSRLAIPVR